MVEEASEMRNRTIEEICSADGQEDFGAGWYEEIENRIEILSKVAKAEIQFMQACCTEDKTAAAEGFRMLARQGHARAQHNLGCCYAKGDGVEKDMVEAVKWFRKAAEFGLDKAQLYLGVCYATGDGVAKDEVEAVKWYRKAAEQGNAAALYVLGLCYEGGVGVEIDLPEALKWYRKAAEQGDDDARSALQRLKQ